MGDATAADAGDGRGVGSFITLRGSTLSFVELYFIHSFLSARPLAFFIDIRVGWVLLGFLSRESPYINTHIHKRGPLVIAKADLVLKVPWELSTGTHAPELWIHTHSVHGSV